MNLRLFVRGVENADELRGHARHKLETAFQRFAPRILAAAVRLEDETGPRKRKVDKVCSIHLKLRSGEIRIREVGADFHQVIDVAIDRARAALGRHVSRAKRGVGEG